jgi:hypothetical protein
MVAVGFSPRESGQYPCRRVATFEKSRISYAASLPVFNKRFVFAHVFLQEVTEVTEKLWQIAFLLFKK